MSVSSLSHCSRRLSLLAVSRNLPAFSLTGINRGKTTEVGFSTQQLKLDRHTPTRQKLVTEMEAKSKWKESPLVPYVAVGIIKNLDFSS